jgi:sugar-specific transcriptional regulator TrmB
MMADDSEFITKLIGFGLSEKEAQLYLHLLKYGAKPPSLLAKSLKTYREDVYRTLTVLIDKGMVKPSLETPSVYTAVELDIALEMALKKHETELRQMEIRKRELQEMSKQQRFRPSDEFSTYKIIKSIRELVATVTSIVNSMESEFLVFCHEPAVVVSSLYGINEAAKMLIDRGGKVRGITDISYPMIELIQQRLNAGEDIRHFSGRGLLFAVFDRKISISAINPDVRSTSLDEPAKGLWTDDSTYADYLVHTFELLWEQSIPAAQRIEELLKEGPPQV